MYKELIAQKLNSMGIPFTISGREFKLPCLNPQHQDKNPSYFINMDTCQTYCFSCKYSKSFKTYLEGELDPEYERTSLYLEALRSLEEEVKPKEDVEVFLPPNSGLPLPAEGIRGISYDLLTTMEVYYCTLGRYRGRLIFPIYDSFKKLLGFDARVYVLPNTEPISPMNPQAKYLRPSYVKTKDILYGLSNIGFTDYVVITEGVFDALSWMELGVPAVCNFGLGAPSTTKVGSLLAVGTTEIMNGFDPDPSGLQGWQDIKEEWRKFLRIKSPDEAMKKFYASGFKDINDYLMNIKGEE